MGKMNKMEKKKLKKEDILYLVIPAYNEEANIRQVIKDWYPIIEAHSGNGRSRMIIVDDGSRDHTCQIVKECAKKRPFLLALTKKNEGHGAALLYGYDYALKHGAEYIFQTDSDGQTVPDEFARFWKLRRQYDMVIGCRSRRQDGFVRIFVTRVLRLVIRICFGVHVMDANTPFRLMNAESLKENLKCVPEKYNLSNVALSVIYARKKQNVKYIPITFRNRQGGVNSIDLKKIIKIGRQAVVDFWKMNAAMDF